MKVNEIMSGRVICIGQDEPVSAAAKMLKRSNIGALPVCDASHRLRGIVTDRDIVTRCVALDADPAETRVAEIMEKLDRAGVNIKYSYAYALGSGAEAILVFSFDDNAKAEAALA